MDQSWSNQQPIRNPQTYQRHRHEVLWQITIPLVIGLVIFVSLAGMAAFSSTAAAKSQMADIALIHLIIMGLFFGLINLVMLAGMAYGIFRLYQVMPEFFLRVLLFSLRVQLAVSNVSKRLTDPLIRVKVSSARRRALQRSLSQVKFR